MIVLDTNVISELARQAPDPGALSWLDSLEVVIRGILTEDFHGRVLPFDERASMRYAEIVTGRERIGRPIGVADAQIAAICRDLGAILATRNTTGFEEAGVELIDPWKLG